MRAPGASYFWKSNAWFSDRVMKTKSQLHRDVRAKGHRMIKKGVDIIDLSSYVIEQPHGSFPAPPDYVIGAVREALKSGWGGTPPLRGRLTLRRAIAERWEREQGIDVDPESNILVSSGGGMQALYNVFQTIINPGDEVLIFCPGLTFDDQVRLAGGVPVYVELKEEEGYKFNSEDVEKAITHKTKVIFLNSPHNPSGHVASREELEGLADVAKDHNLLVISDEILFKWVYDGREHISIASLPDMQERTIIESSVTKSGMFDWRIGWIIANEEFIKQVEKVMFWQNEISPPLLQIAAEAHLERLDSWITDIVKEEQERRDLICNELGKIDGLSVVKPQGCTMCFPNISNFERDSIKFVDYLIEEGHVLVQPGVSYLGEGHVRIGFHRTKEEIKEAIERLGKAAAKMPEKSGEMRNDKGKLQPQKGESSYQRERY